jgi:hypothetical protein
MSYERKLLQGIPVYVKDGGVYTWNDESQIRFGSVTEGSNTITFDAGWEEVLAPHVETWRKTLQPRSRTELRNVRKNTVTKSK